MEKSYKILIWVLIVIAVIIFLFGMYLGVRICAGPGNASAEKAKKQYEQKIKGLERENYRLIMLDSSLSVEARQTQTAMDGMQLRETDLKTQLKTAQNSIAKFKYLYENLNRYNTFTGRDIRRYFTDSLGQDSRQHR